MKLTQENVCLHCLDRPIVGKPWSVYFCRECYDQATRSYALDGPYPEPDEDGYVTFEVAHIDGSPSGRGTPQ